MRHRAQGAALLAVLASLAVTLPAPSPAAAAGVSGESSSQLDAASQAALQKLYASQPKTRQIGAKSRAILVFPKILKGGLMIGGQTGDGTLFEAGRPVAHYNLSAGSYGFQAGVQTYSYVMFFMTASSLDYLQKNSGWSVGSGPSFVLMDKGMAKNINTTTLSEDVYVVPFGQKGLMGGTGLEGTKITEIHPEP